MDVSVRIRQRRRTSLHLAGVSPNPLLALLLRKQTGLGPVLADSLSGADSLACPGLCGRGWVVDATTISDHRETRSTRRP